MDWNNCFFRANKILKRGKIFSQKFNKISLVFKLEETGIKFYYREMEL
jgi:hypothetical protein